MKTLAIGLAATSLWLGLAAAGGPNASTTSSGVDFPAGCLVPVGMPPGYLPRASLAVENGGAERVTAWLEARRASGLVRVELGVLEAGAQLASRHVLPAGRNVLHARSESGRAFRLVLYVKNHGADTCARRYRWPIQ